MVRDTDGGDVAIGADQHPGAALHPPVQDSVAGLLEPRPPVPDDRAGAHVLITAGQWPPGGAHFGIGQIHTSHYRTRAIP